MDTDSALADDPKLPISFRLKDKSHAPQPELRYSADDDIVI